MGRVGEGVGINGVTPETEMKQLQRVASKHPEEWIAQRKFEIVPVRTDEGPRYPCIGVFTIEGRAAGFYGRVSTTPIINNNAQDAAVLISE